MDGITRHAHYSTFRKEPTRDIQPSFGDETWKAKRRCRVDAKPFVDTCIEVFVEMRLQSALSPRVVCQVINDCAARAGTASWSNGCTEQMGKPTWMLYQNQRSLKSTPRPSIPPCPSDSHRCPSPPEVYSGDQPYPLEANSDVSSQP